MATHRDAKIRNAREAVELAQWGVQLSEGHEPLPWGTLAAAYAEGGRFRDAVKCADRGIALADARRDTGVANALRRQREHYQKGTPYHE